MKESYDEKREQIKKSALQVFAKYGYYKTTLDDIAEAVGIKKNSLYYYFQSKEGLFEEIIKEEFVKLYDRVTNAVNDVDDHKDKLSTFFKQFMCFGRNKSHDIAISLEIMIEIGQVIEDSFHEYLDKIKEMLRELLDAGCKAGIFRKHDTEESAELLLEFISSFEREQVRKNKIRNLDSLDYSRMENKVLGLLKYFINGIAKV